MKKFLLTAFLILAGAFAGFAQQKVTVTGTVPLPTGAATGVAQDSTTSGEVGTLTQCAVTTSAPTYTTAHTSPCSVDTTGALRITGSISAGGVAQASTTSGQDGNLTQGATTTSAPTYTTAKTNPLSLQTDGSLRTAVTNLPADAAIGAPATSNPAQTGGLFETSPSTITNGQVAGFHFTNGQLLLISEPSPVSRAVTNAGTFAVQATQVYSGSASGVTSSMTSTTSTSVIAGTASNYVYVESCSVNNTHASVDTLVDLQDGSGGTIIWTFTAPHSYGGESHYFGKPGLKVPTVGNGLFAVDKTTGAAVIVSCNGTKSTVSQ